jgi:hypothetical protein
MDGAGSVRYSMSIIRFQEEFDHVETPTKGSPVYVYCTGPGCQYVIGKWDQSTERPANPAEWDGRVMIPARTVTELVCRLLQRADYYDVESIQDALESYHTDWMDGL